MAADRIYVRVSPDERVALERMARVGQVGLGALLRETTLGYGPVWVANRAADRVAGRDVKRVRARNQPRERCGCGEFWRGAVDGPYRVCGAGHIETDPPYS